MYFFVSLSFEIFTKKNCRTKVTKSASMLQLQYTNTDNKNKHKYLKTR